MESTEPQLLGTEAELAPLARDRASLPQDFRALKEVGEYQLDFTPAGGELVVSFDADNSNPNPSHLPWLHKPFRDEGLAVLGVKMKRADWFRGEALHDFFQSQDFHHLVGAYDKVLFTGSAMGGFAALTFSTPGALVVAHNPQTTLDPQLTPWDTRFPDARQLDWSGRFARAEEGARQAARVFVTYDPFDAIDSRHVDRLDPANLVRLKAPLLGTPLPGFLRRIGLLAELVPLALSGELTAEWWHAAIRKRRELARYHLLMAEHVDTPDRAARLMARAWHLSEDERRTQERIRRMVANRKLDELFERHLAAAKASRVAGPAGPDQELFLRFMAGRP
jgi:hypothetical protein